MKKVIFILGPTAVGKSDMAINLAKEFDGEIISADSVQVFKGLDIGSAKIMPHEMQGITHHFIDICHPNQEFSVAEFKKITEEKIEEIFMRNKLPIIVGGTFLYVKALTEGYNFGDTGKNQAFRDQLQKEIELNGAQALWERLNKISPSIAESIHVNNTKRLIRELEIIEFGENKTSSMAKFNFKIFALSIDRQVLYQRINSRVDKMLEQGLVNEVKNLIDNGTDKNSQSMRAIGYKEVVSFLDGECQYQDMVELIKQHSRNYAKRQLTFLRSMQNVDWIDMSDVEKGKNDILDKSKRWLNDNN